MSTRALLLALLALPTLAAATTITHAGYALGSDDQPLTGTHTFTFRLTSDPAGTSVIWTGNPCALVVRAGYYTASLGDECTGSPALTPTVLPAYLEVTLDTVLLTPRLALATTPRAEESAHLGGYDVAGLQTLFDARYPRFNPGTAQAGGLSLVGAVSAGSFSGTGTGLTALDGSKITTGVVGVGVGGTGATSLTANAVVIGGASALGTVAGAGSAGLVLTSNAVGSAPSWQALPAPSASTISTGVLGVGVGGTGATSLTANAVLLGAGTGAVTPLAPAGSAGLVLTSNAAGAAPSWQALSALGLESGILKDNDVSPTVCMKLKLKPGVHQILYQPINCTTGANLGLSQDSNGVWQVGTGGTRLSCLDYYTAFPSSQTVDGKYLIDVDGVASAHAAQKVYCDMNGGGYTRAVVISASGTEHHLASQVSPDAVADGSTGKLSDAAISLLVTSTYKLICGAGDVVRTTACAWHADSAISGSSCFGDTNANARGLNDGSIEPDNSYYGYAGYTGCHNGLINSWSQSGVLWVK